MKALMLALLAGLPAAWTAAQQQPRQLAPAQAWADADRDGRLDAGESRRLVDALRALVSGVHDVDGRLDELADANGDRRIDAAEAGRARNLWLLEPLAALVDTAPGPARFVDLDSSGSIDKDEIEMAADFVWRDPMLRKPRPAGGALDQRLDANGDGRVDEKEIAEALARLVVALTAASPGAPGAQRPAPPAVTPQAPRAPQPAARPLPPHSPQPRQPSAEGPQTPRSAPPPRQLRRAT